MRRKIDNLGEALQLPPRWRSWLAVFLLIIGVVFFLGVIADPLGTLHTPGPGAAVFMLFVVVVASLLAHRDRRYDRRARK